MLCSTEFSDQMHTRSVSRVECIPSDGFSLADRGIAPHICTFREDQGGKIQGRPGGKIRVEMGIARGLLPDLHTAPSNAIPTDAAGRDLEDVTFQDLFQANVV